MYVSIYERDFAVPRVLCSFLSSLREFVISSYTFVKPVLNRNPNAMSNSEMYEQIKVG